MLTSDPVVLDRRIYQQADSLTKDNFQVTIAYTNPDLLLPEERNEDIIFLCRPVFDHRSNTKFKGFRLWKKIKNLGSSCVFAIRIYQYLNARFYKTSESWRDGLLKHSWEQYDLIVCHDVPLLPAALDMRQQNVAPRVLLDAHEIFDAQYDAIYSKYARKYWFDICKTYEKQCDRVTTVTKLIAEHMTARHELEIEPDVIENSYPFTNAPLFPSEALRKTYQIASGNKIVLCMGEMRPGRGLEDLILAMQYLKNSNISLCFLGHVEPSYAQSLTKIVKKIYVAQCLPWKKSRTKFGC